MNRISVITGPAGSGKTTYIEELAQSAQTRGQKLFVTSSTGTGANRINEHLKIDFAVTLHSLIYQYDEERSSVGRDIFEIRNHLHKNVLLIVDEAGMLQPEVKSDNSSELVFGTGDILRDTFTSFNISPDSDFHLILLGDECQLPPVGESESLLLNKPYLEERYNIEVEHIRLTKNYRVQTMPLISAYLSDLRTKIKEL